MAEGRLPKVANVPVEVWQLARDDEGHDVVLLRDEQSRILPIVIGVCEAAAILVKLSPEVARPYVRRPWSHDLIQAMLERFGAVLERVEIDGVSRGVFFATLHLRYRDQELVIDARPSDAIALLLRMSAPVFVNTEVMDDAAFYLDEQEDNEE